MRQFVVNNIVETFSVTVSLDKLVEYLTECTTIQIILPRDATLNLALNTWRITSSLKIVSENLLVSFLSHAGWFSKRRNCTKHQGDFRLKSAQIVNTLLKIQ